MDAVLLVENAVHWGCSVADEVGYGGASAVTDVGSLAESRLLTANLARRPGTRRRHLDPASIVSRCITLTSADKVFLARCKRESPAPEMKWRVEGAAWSESYPPFDERAPPPKNVGRQTHWYNDRENSFPNLYPNST